MRALRLAEPVFWAGGALALARVPAVARAVPALGVLRGPLGVALGLFALALAAGAALSRWPPFERRRERLTAAPRPPVLFAAAFALLAAVGLHYAAGLRVSGDEPHYLLMAQSLWREHDLDLADNLAREDWREYTPGPLAPHYGAPRKDGRPFPAHSPGLPFLLAPVYAAGGRLACVALLAALAAWISVEAHRAALRLTGDPEAALLAWAAAAGPPAAFYAFHVYTEIPSALALALGLRLLARRAATTPRAAAAAALAAGALPWLHVKMIPAAAALGVIALAVLRGRARAVFLAVAAVTAAVYLGYYAWIFGTASPLALYGGVPAGESGSPLRAVAGLLLDRSFGLLPYAPVFLLALAGVVSLARRRAGAELLVAAAVLAPVVGWRMWWGGQCPPARFLVPLVPVLALAVAARATGGRGMARWRWALAGLGLAMLLVTSGDPGRLFLVNRGDRPTRLWTAASGEVAAGGYLPSLVSRDPADARVAVVWVAALALLLALDALARRKDAVDRLFRSFGLPLVLLLAIGIATDAWARNERKESHRGTEPQRTEKNESPAIE